jgi:nucleotide-binding universal stress UspA family protein
VPLIQRILLATDFSPTSNRALEYAASLASSLSARLLILHVMPEMVAAGPDGLVFLNPSNFDDVEAQLETAIGDAKRRAESLGASSTEVLLIQGRAWQEIVRVAADRSCDLIVMGTHGLSGFEHLLLGSVAEKVLRKAPCPVMTIRAA